MKIFGKTVIPIMCFQFILHFNGCIRCIYVQYTCTIKQAMPRIMFETISSLLMGWPVDQMSMRVCSDVDYTE